MNQIRVTDQQRTTEPGKFAVNDGQMLTDLYRRHLSCRNGMNNIRLEIEFPIRRSWGRALCHNLAQGKHLWDVRTFFVYHSFMKFLLVFLSLVVYLPTVSAQKEITKDEFSGTFKKAFKKSYMSSRRQTKTTETLKDGKLVETTRSRSEYVHPNRMRFVLVEIKDGIWRQTEEIRIAKLKYCKTDGGEWSIVKKRCVPSDGIGGHMNSVSAKYTVEETELDGKKVRLFSEYIIYKNIFAPDKRIFPDNYGDGLWFWDHKYWLSKNGRLIRQELNKGLVQPQTHAFRSVTVHEFSDDIRIEPPIM